jgi:hypothetical protein
MVYFGAVSPEETNWYLTGWCLALGLPLFGVGVAGCYYHRRISGGGK